MKQVKEKVFNIRISESELETIEKASAIRKLSKSAYARMVLVNDAERLVEIASRIKKPV